MLSVPNCPVGYRTVGRVDEEGSKLDERDATVGELESLLLAREGGEGGGCEKSSGVMGREKSIGPARWKTAAASYVLRWDELRAGGTGAARGEWYNCGMPCGRGAETTSIALVIAGGSLGEIAAARLLRATRGQWAEARWS